MASLRTVNLLLDDALFKLTHYHRPALSEPGNSVILRAPIDRRAATRVFKIGHHFGFSEEFLQRLAGHN